MSEEKKKVLIFTTRNFFDESIGETKNLFTFRLKENTIESKTCELFDINKYHQLKHFHLINLINKEKINDKIDEIKKDIVKQIDGMENMNDVINIINEYIIDSFLLSSQLSKIVEKNISIDSFLLSSQLSKIVGKNISDAEKIKELKKFIKNDLFNDLSKNKNIDIPIAKLVEALPSKPDKLELRQFIFRRKNRDENGNETTTNIFGYRCLDLPRDIVDTRKGFITALVSDVAEIMKSSNLEDKDSSLEDFFKNYELILVLHGDDIDKSSVYPVMDTENKKLIYYNEALEKYTNNIKTYVYSHTNNFFTQMMENYEGKTADKLVERIENYFENREKFETKENNLFDGDIKNTKEYVKSLKDILSKYFKNEKIY